MNEEQFDFLDKILEGNEIEIPENINSIFDSGSKTELYDKKRSSSFNSKELETL